MLKHGVLILAIAGCGGGSKAAPMKPMDPMTAAPSECATMATHVAEVVMTFKDPPPTTKDVVADVVRQHCESDGWSADAKKCFASFTDEESAKGCVGTLTETQHDSVMKDMMAHAGHDPDTGSPAEAPPPAPPAGGGPADSSDPCEGGE